MRDFTLKIYGSLLEALLNKGYIFVRFDEYITSLQSSVVSQQSSFIPIGVRNVQSSIDDNSKISQRDGKPKNLPERWQAKKSKIVILRHDVDLRPENSLITASIEKGLGIRGSYYFRMIPAVFNKSIIKDIESLGHEIGYHYETMATSNGDIDKAYDEFSKNLVSFRKISDIKTICMHGSPLSKFDNKLLWSQRDAFGTKYSYKDLGIIGEPYFDIDWNEFGYLTDTGRTWNNGDISIRDRVGSKYKFKFKSTKDIINALDQNQLPDKLMITIHPQRWSNNPILRIEEFVLQNIKNIVKRIIVKK